MINYKNNSKKTLLIHEKCIPKPSGLKVITDNNPDDKTRFEPLMKVGKNINITESTARICSPKLLSTLKLSEQIGELSSETQKSKTYHELQYKEELAFNKKILRKVNFPHSQEIYKGLVPLFPSSKLQTKQVKSTSLSQKEEGPYLLDFIKATKVPNTCYIPSFPLQNLSPITNCRNNFRLYISLHINKE